MERTKPTKQLRNRVLTEADFIDQTVEEIVSNGFRNFTGTGIAGRVGRHSSRINDLFGSVKGLLKAAITTRCHWGRLFKKYRIRNTAGEKETRELFVEMMCENFVDFKANREMQHMILGQMTVNLDALREVSEYREQEGEKMLRRAAPYFEDTGVCFNIILALMLGGSYNIVLHSEVTGGTFAGIDINNEDTLLKVKQHMRYLIELAWADAGRKRKALKRERKKKGL